MLITKQLRCLSRRLSTWNINKTSRNYSNNKKGRIGFECLEKRGLLLVKGDEVSEFLQGLITNDMRHFDNGLSNIYGLFLNIKGRVLYDTIIYKSPMNDTSYLIECDKDILKSLERHLNIYKIRRKIEIRSLEKEMRIWTLFNLPPDLERIQNTNLNEDIFPCGGLKNKSSRSVDDSIFIFADPRVSSNCLRILSNCDVDGATVKQSLADEIPPDCGDELNYREFRYQMGIGEGVDEVPPGKALPLEMNCDYLHGVSFHKGCYIGQELTARTYHTGVIRKRLMPLIFQEQVSGELNYDDNITDDAGKTVGKFRAVEGKYGLGLIRISEALNAKNLILNHQSLTVVKPFWWPVDGNQNMQIKLEKK